VLEDNQDRILALFLHIIDRPQAPSGTSGSRAANANGGTLRYGACAVVGCNKAEQTYPSFRLSKSIKMEGTGGRVS